MKRGFFITGTGTGVGKTFVTAKMAEHARAQGDRVFAFKPIETGCNPIGEDQEILAKAAGDWQEGELRNLYCFKRPLAPLAAATAEGRDIDLVHVERVFARGAQLADLALVEGAGGWRVPITRNEDMGALAKRLNLPIIIVGLSGLGTINHSTLTVEAVRADGCEVARVILSSRPHDDPAFAMANATEIARLCRCEVVIVSP